MGDLDKVRAAYPAAVPGEDFVLRDHSDGQGARIEGWNEAKLGPVPDLSSLPEPPEGHDYEERRREAYPPVGDQLDAIWKQLNQDRLGGKALIQQADDTLNEILAVKAKYPPPAER